MTTRPPIGEHQERAIDEIMQRDSLLIEYGTGTGKTRIYAEAIEALILAGEAPVLVLVPNSLIEQTTDEFRFWLGPDWSEKFLMVLNGGFSIEDRRQPVSYTHPSPRDS